MADEANLVVLEPGKGLAPVDVRPLPRLSLAVSLAPGDPASKRVIELEVSEAGVGKVLDVLHRIGGEDLVAELRAALGWAARDARNFAEAKLANEASEWVGMELAWLRQEAGASLAMVDLAARQVFEHDLSLAELALRPDSFGIVVGADGKVTAATSEPGRAIYRAFRLKIAELDRLYRKVKAWKFTIPPNAPTARRQFEQTALEPYLSALKKSAETWPVLVVMGPRIVKELESQRPDDIQAWASGTATTTPLDEVIQEQLVAAYRKLRDEQSGYRAKILAAADEAMRAVGRSTGQTWEDPPEAIVAERHPFWAYPFLVQAAMERQGFEPGDHGHAVVTTSLRYAANARARQQAARTDIDRMLTFASIGFGVLSLVPVIGQLGLVAAIAISAVQTLEETQSWLDQSEASGALGHQVQRYGVIDPDATGFLCGLLSLTSDLALPVMGKLLQASVLRPASRALAAARVKKVLDLGENAADIAGMALEANAEATTRELDRLGLLTDGRGR